MIAINPLMMQHLPGSDDIHRVILPNGIVLLTRYHPESPSIVLNGYLPSGSMYDPTAKLGRAHFTALSILRGTKQRTFQQFFDTLESIGASLMFAASVHSTTFGGRALSEDLPALASLLSETLQFPAFPEEQIQRLRAQILASLSIRAQDTGAMASMRFDHHIFPNHPYGLPEDGQIETIQGITREDLFQAHREYFGPRGMVVAVTGGVPHETVETILTEALGNWQNPDQKEEEILGAPQAPQLEVREHIQIAGKSQSDLVLGNAAMQRSSQDYFAASLANNILGQFGMMGRIGYSVREKAGLAYYAGSSLNASKAAGSWEINAGVNPNNVEKAIQLIQEEVRRFIDEGVSTEELEESQANFIGRLPLSMESNQGVAGALINMERYQLGLDYYRTYAEKIAAISAEQIQQTAAQYLHPERMVIISAGVAA